MNAIARSAFLIGAFFLQSPATAYDPAECPSGTHRISTDNPYEPFRCVKDVDERAKIDPVLGSKGFAKRPHCPRGMRSVASPPNSIQPYRCIPVRAIPSEPDAALAAQQMSPNAAKGPLTKDSMVAYALPQQVSFDYPEDFRVLEAWTEDLPTLYLSLDQPAGGKPIVITIRRMESRQPGFVSATETIRHDADWDGAKESSPFKVAGYPARETVVPNAARNVYATVSAEEYYAISYSAPPGAYALYMPGFDRLLKTFRFGAKAR